MSSWRRLVSSSRPHRGGSERVGAALIAATLAGGLTAMLAGSGSAEAASQPTEASMGALVDDVVGMLAGVGGPGTTTTTPGTIRTVVVTPTTSLAEVVPAASAQRGPLYRRCNEGRQAVEATGLVLPPDFEYRCPGNTQLFAGDRQHWGVACYFASLCPGGAYIAINPDRIGTSNARLRHVIAHEICHALDVKASRPMSEPAADACAASHGFPQA